MTRFNLSEWAVNNKSLIVFLMLLCVIGGIGAYERLGRQEDPDFSVQTMVVQISWPGATAIDTLKQVTNRLEKKLEETPNLDYLKSYTKPGQATVFVYLKESTKKPRSRTSPCPRSCACAGRWFRTDGGRSWVGCARHASSHCGWKLNSILTPSGSLQNTWCTPGKPSGPYIEFLRAQVCDQCFWFAGHVECQMLDRARVIAGRFFAPARAQGPPFSVGLRRPPIDMAPATSPATPAIGTSDWAAAAPPTIRLAVDTMPSFAPSTALRSQPTPRLGSIPELLAARRRARWRWLRPPSC